MVQVPRKMGSDPNSSPWRCHHNQHKYNPSTAGPWGTTNWSPWWPTSVGKKPPSGHRGCHLWHCMEKYLCYSTGFWFKLLLCEGCGNWEFFPKSGVGGMGYVCASYSWKVLKEKKLLLICLIWSTRKKLPLEHFLKSAGICEWFKQPLPLEIFVPIILYSVNLWFGIKHSNIFLGAWLMTTGGFSSSGCGGFFPLLSILVYFKTPVTECRHITPSPSRSTAGNPLTGLNPGITATRFA